MQEQIWTSTCDNPSCTGTGSPYPSSPTVETVTSGVSDRPDINWTITYDTARSVDNTQLNLVGIPLQFCQPACIIAYYQAELAAAQSPPVSGT